MPKLLVCRLCVPLLLFLLRFPLRTSVIGSAPAAAPLSGSQAAVSVDGSLPVSVPPPAVREPAPADTLPSRKSHNSPAEVEQKHQSLGQNTANFAS